MKNLRMAKLALAVSLASWSVISVAADRPASLSDSDTPAKLASNESMEVGRQGRNLGLSETRAEAPSTTQSTSVDRAGVVGGPENPEAAQSSARMERLSNKAENSATMRGGRESTTGDMNTPISGLGETSAAAGATGVAGAPATGTREASQRDTAASMRTGAAIDDSGRTRNTIGTTNREEQALPQANSAGAATAAPTNTPADSRVHALYETVRFDDASLALSEEAESTLEGLVQRMDPEEPVALSVRVQGYTEIPLQPDEEALSHTRAQAVKDYLEEQGIEVAAWVVDTVGGDAQASSDLQMPADADQQQLIITIMPADSSVGISAASSD